MFGTALSWLRYLGAVLLRRFDEDVTETRAKLL